MLSNATHQRRIHAAKGPTAQLINVGSCIAHRSPDVVHVERAAVGGGWRWGAERRRRRPRRVGGRPCDRRQRGERRPRTDSQVCGLLPAANSAALMVNDHTNTPITERTGRCVGESDDVRTCESDWSSESVWVRCCICDLASWRCSTVASCCRCRSAYWACNCCRSADDDRSCVVGRGHVSLLTSLDPWQRKPFRGVWCLLL